MELLGLKFDLWKIFRKGRFDHDVTLIDRTKSLNLFQIFEHFYHIETFDDLIQSIKDDFVSSVFMNSGSGLFSSFLRGLYFRIFMNYKLPAMVGKSFKVVNKSKIKIAEVFWAKDYVTLFAGGPLEIGKSGVLAERSTIWSGKDGVYIGDNFFLGMGSYISAISGKVVIGDDVMIADNVSLYTWNHKFGRGKKSFSEMGGSIKSIEIGNNCWLGSGVKVLAGTKLGRNCVVGAGSVLTGKFPDNCVLAGVPARVVRKI